MPFFAYLFRSISVDFGTLFRCHKVCDDNFLGLLFVFFRWSCFFRFPAASRTRFSMILVDFRPIVGRCLVDFLAESWSTSPGFAGNLPGCTVGLRCFFSGAPLGYGDLPSGV
jgi:hypothetical protein